MAEDKIREKLFTEFPEVSTEEWEKKIQVDLKGADYAKKLIWRTNEGLNVRPYYRAEDLENINHIEALPGEFPYVRGTKTKNNDWHIRQDFVVENPAEANKKALDVLMKGVDSLCFLVFNKEFSADDMRVLLQGIELSAIEINFSACINSPKILGLFIDEVKNRGCKPEDVKGSIDYDPLGYMTLTGECYDNEKCCGMQKAKELIEEAKATLPNFRLIAVNGYFIHNSGASIVQELGFALAQGNEYLARGTEQGIDIDELAGNIRFNFAVGSNYFMEIAKLRAARMLWAKIVKQYNPKTEKACQMNVHSVTSRWNKTIYDPYANMLRSTTEAMSATIGGTDSLTVESFNAAFGKPTDFSERIARNQQILLKEESYFDRIVDPSAGSYYIENLTTSVAEEAWKLFVSVEEKGGYIAAFKEGFVQSEVKKVAQKRDMNIATRREIFLGTNQYPNFNEAIKDDVDFGVLNMKMPTAKNPIAEPLKMYRGAQAFEELRLSTENHTHKPKAYMFTYGNLAMRRARSMFASNFFACAGYEVVDNLGFESVNQGVEASIKNEADIVVVCSSDDEYATIVPEIYEKLKGKATVVVAGNPKNCIDDLKSKGIEHFIHVRTNVLETLQNFQTILGIK